MEEHNYDMERVVEHTKGLAEDEDLTRGEAAVRMADYLDGLEAKDIISEM